MEFFLEMLFTAIVALLFSFLVAKLVSLAMAENVDGGGTDPTSDQEEKPEISFSDGFVTEEIRFAMKMDARVLETESKFQVVDRNVDLFGTGAGRVAQLEEAVTENGKVRAQGGELVVRTAEAESTVTISPENVLAKEMVVTRQDEHIDGSGGSRNSPPLIDGEPEKLVVHTTEAESTTSVSPENVVTEEIMIRGQEERSESTERRIACVESEESGHVSVAESEEARVEESNTIVESESMEEASKETEELSIEEDDDWEGIERSELEKAFAITAKCVEESEKAEEIGAEAKMRLYGLHKIATEGIMPRDTTNGRNGLCSCKMHLKEMICASDKQFLPCVRNAWQVLGNMSQEEAMEQYLELISKEIPGLMNIGYTGY